MRAQYVALFFFLSILQSIQSNDRFIPGRLEASPKEIFTNSNAFFRALSDNSDTYQAQIEASNKTADIVTTRLRGDTELGYYFITFFFGTPLQKQTLIVDTGSVTTTIPCIECGNNCGSHHFNKPFDHTTSTSFQEFKCLEKFGNYACNDCTNQCSFSVAYVEGSSYSGHFKKDFVAFGNEIEDLYDVLSGKTADQGNTRRLEEDSSNPETSTQTAPQTSDTVNSENSNNSGDSTEAVNSQTSNNTTKNSEESGNNEQSQNSEVVETSSNSANSGNDTKAEPSNEETLNKPDNTTETNSAAESSTDEKSQNTENVETSNNSTTAESKTESSNQEALSKSENTTESTPSGEPSNTENQQNSTDSNTSGQPIESNNSNNTLSASAPIKSNDTSVPEDSPDSQSSTNSKNPSEETASPKNTTSSEDPQSSTTSSEPESSNNSTTSESSQENATNSGNSSSTETRTSESSTTSETATTNTTENSTQSPSSNTTNDTNSEQKQDSQPPTNKEMTDEEKKHLEEKNFVESVVKQRKTFFPFGCTDRETKLFYNQEADGILGLGVNTDTNGSPPNLIDTMHRNNPSIKKAFSMCLAQLGGYFTTGGYNFAYHELNEKIYYTDYYDNYGQYRVHLNKIEVQGKDIGLSPSTLNHGEGAFFDSGTTLTHIPMQTYNAIKTGLYDYCSANPKSCGRRVLTEAFCFIYDPNAYSTVDDFLQSFPTFTFYFGKNGDAKYDWKGQDYLTRKGEAGKYCMGLSHYERETILGGTFMKNHDVLFDKENRKIAFVRADCSAINFITKPEYLYSTKVEQKAADTPNLKSAVESEVAINNGYDAYDENDDEAQAVTTVWSKIKGFIIFVLVVTFIALLGLGIVKLIKKKKYSNMNNEIEIPEAKGAALSFESNIMASPDGNANNNTINTIHSLVEASI